LAAFSQFASDLDDATRAQLEHGERVTELMKQMQYAPMNVAETAVSLFTAEKGHLKDVDIAKIGDFESALLSFMNSEYADLMADINSTGKYNDEIESALNAAIEKFKSTQTY
jgi:F-type H+-transporting ATPase subunit alpha